jgi:hypothetical protein
MGAIAKIAGRRGRAAGLVAAGMLLSVAPLGLRAQDTPAPPRADNWTIAAGAETPEAKVEDLGVMVSLGSVAPSHTLGPSSDRDGLSIYTFAQRGHSVDELVEINIQSGKVTKYDPKMQGDPWRQMWGQDGKWYYGAGHLLAFDPQRKQVEDLGAPSGGQMVHSPCWGPDGRIWIGCCTKGTLCCYDPQRKKWDDYGQIGPPPPPKLPHYAEVLGFDDGWVLVHRRNLPIVLAAVNMQTKQMNTLFAQEKSGQSYSLRWIDEQAHVTIQDVGADGKPFARHYTVEAGDLKAVSQFPAGSGDIKTWTRLGRFVPPGYSPPGGQIPKTLVGSADPSQPTRMVAWWQFAGQPWKKTEFEAPASPERLFRIKTMPDGRIFGSTYDLRVCFVYDPATGKSRTLGPLSSGYNVYDFAFHGGKTYLIGYAGAILFEYDPTRPWGRGRTDPAHPPTPWPHRDPTDNPRAVGGIQMKHGHQLLVGADGCIYMKGYPTREDVGGGLAYYDPATQTNTILREPFRVLAITGIAPVRDGRLIAIGTRVDPDPLNRTPAPPAAKIFLFDTQQKKLVAAAVPFPDRKDTGQLVEGRPGMLLGVIPDTQQNKTLVYWFDTERHCVTGQATLDGVLSGPQPGLDGALWAFHGGKPAGPGKPSGGLADDHLVRIDPGRRTIEPRWKLKRCRFIFSGRDLYFIRDPAGEESAHLFRVKGVL